MTRCIKVKYKKSLIEKFQEKIYKKKSCKRH
nr:MAG TPA: hypothetical protein [Caudoviricetes sp.]